MTVPHESTFVEMTNAIDPVAMPEDLPDTLAASIAQCSATGTLFARSRRNTTPDRPTGNPPRREVYTGRRVRCYILPRYKTMLRECKEMPRTLFRSGRRGVERPGIGDTPEALGSNEPSSEDSALEPGELHRVEATLLKPTNEADTLKAVSAYITQHPDDPGSRALAALVGALYQDANAFSFEALDCLGPVTRRYAERLISARLWGALPEAEWQQAVSIASSFELKDSISRLTSSAKAPEPNVVIDPRLGGAHKASSEATPLPEPRLAAHRGAVEPILRPESRLVPAPKSSEPVMLSTSARPSLRPRSLIGERADNAQQFAPAGASESEPFNLENVGRHWRVLLWLGLAAIGLTAVLYL